MMNNDLTCISKECALNVVRGGGMAIRQDTGSPFQETKALRNFIAGKSPHPTKETAGTSLEVSE